MFRWLRAWRARRREHLLDELEGEAESERETEPKGFTGGFAQGSGRRTPYDDGHTHDQWSE